MERRSPAPQRRLLVVGIDAATLDLVRPWAEQGDLPRLGRLLADGAWGRLRSVPSMVTPAAWSTFATGCNPGAHGVFSFTERLPGSYEERYTSGATRAGTPFWVLLNRAGVRCTVVDVPWTYPADAVDGVMISGMDAPGPDAPGFVHPPSLAADLRRRFDPLLGTGWSDGGIGDLVARGRLDAAREFLARRVEARTDLCRYLMEHHPGDLLCVVHTEVDRIQHFFWEFVDPRAPRVLAREAARHRDGILRIYQAVDRSIEALAAAFGPSHVIVVSDHGAGLSPGSPDAWIRAVLEHQGWAARRLAGDPVRRAARAGLARLYRTLAPWLPRSVTWRLRQRGSAVARSVAAALAYEYDWSRTRAFCLSASGEVWLNVRGREPMGVVEPGEEYDRLRRRIRDVFLRLRDATTGQPVVEAVEFRDEIYHGPFVERAPDLLIRFAEVAPAALALDGEVIRRPRQAPSPRDLSAGGHRPDGMIVLAGAGVRQGVEVHDARLQDVAPTLLYWMGQAVPASMDGRVLVGAFTPEYLRAHPIQTSEATGPARTQPGYGYTGEEAARIAERLRRLGYM
ncbi:MAG: alkaline phosphatase family protein [Armatimonadota bacterium]|nr:alkaline phosphatase family protein [Armatimonadota bacterium]MDR7454359.1 alkaline phosphatase family protein [Armatimonadota bacterium]MDR7455969.1 alkaline phosphatase family protein [Armatimonadota bacterium]MDR7496160.1 alkaline phosphatase family protein [Armatimonadota bacterium]MDR7511347.1 alkaline phosphatase family protein [Armatimonadota bacterium]